MNEVLTKSENELLIQRIKDGDTLLDKVTNAYNKTAMDYNKASSKRESMKVVLKNAFEWLEDGMGGTFETKTFDKQQIINAIEIMHDDSTFFEEFMRFFADHIDTFGENYGLEFED